MRTLELLHALVRRRIQDLERMTPREAIALEVMAAWLGVRGPVFELDVLHELEALIAWHRGT